MRKIQIGILIGIFIVVSATITSVAGARLNNPPTTVQQGSAPFGINTTSPIGDLSVQGTGLRDPFVITSSTGADMLRLLTSGVLRMPNNVAIVGRNAANTADLPLIYRDNINRTLIGDASNAILMLGDMGFGTDNNFDIGGGQRSPRMIFAKTNITAGSSTMFATLSVFGVGSTNPFEVRSSTNATLLKVLTNGNIGIGTSTPVSLFSVSSANTTTLFLDSVSASRGVCIVGKDSDGVGYTYLTVNNGTITASTNDCR